jgi:hypothetical protein
MKVETQEDGRIKFERESWREWFMFEFSQGMTVPKGYGLAWWRPNGRGVALPVLINVVVGFARRLYISILAGISPSALERMLLQQRKVADKEGYHRAIQQTQLQLETRYAKRLELIVSNAPPDPTADDVDEADPNHVAEQLGDAAAAELEIEVWTQEERVFFAAAQALAVRKGDALFFACQDPRCKDQPIIARVDAEGGFSLACFHKRRWVPNPPKGQTAPLSRRQLSKLGVH